MKMNKIAVARFSRGNGAKMWANAERLKLAPKFMCNKTQQQNYLYFTPAGLFFSLPI